MNLIKNEESITTSDNFTKFKQNILIQTCVGAVAALILLINPITGAIFGGVYALVSTYAAPLIDKFLSRYFDNELTSQIKKWAMSFFAGIAIAAIIVTMVGFPISFAAAFGLCLAMIPLSLVCRCSQFINNLKHQKDHFQIVNSAPNQASYTNQSSIVYMEEDGLIAEQQG